MTANYDPDAPKTAEEIELQDAIMQLDAQYRAARAGSAERRMIERQLDAIRRGSELGSLLIDEYHMSAFRPHW